jgi:antirestriction protein ArdC
MAASPYEIVAKTIIEQLEKGVAPWRKEWVSNGYTPLSLSTKKPYSGVNHWLLSFSAMSRNYESPWWGTYRQIEEQGGVIRKGEKGTPVVLWKQIDTEADGETESETITKKATIMRYFTVFNAEQVEWSGPAPAYEKATAREHGNVIATASKVVDNYFKNGPELRYGGDRAFYSPSKDLVQLPEPATFFTDEAFYATAFHEMGHSTGHKSRLNREGVVESHYFGSELYSEEELVAEFTSAFLSNETGIAPATLDNSASYIASWLKVLKNDPKMLVKAVGRAQKSADYILGREK